jgi:hypothetical protein
VPFIGRGGSSPPSDTHAGDSSPAAGRLPAGNGPVDRLRPPRGSATPTGKPWRSPTVRNLLRSPRNAGSSEEYRGQVVGTAVWEPIVTPEQHAQAVAILQDPTRCTNRTARRYLLSDLLRCGLCGGKLWSMSRHETGEHRYLCAIRARLRRMRRHHHYRSARRGTNQRSRLDAAGRATSRRTSTGSPVSAHGAVSVEAFPIRVQLGHPGIRERVTTPRLTEPPAEQLRGHRAAAPGPCRRERHASACPADSVGFPRRTGGVDPRARAVQPGPERRSTAGMHTSCTCLGS